MDESQTSENGYQNDEPKVEEKPPTPSVIIPPIVTPPVSELSVIAPKPNLNNPGLIVLQWLTYAFWGWTVIAMSVLTSLVLVFLLIKDADIGDSVLYSMAAVLVLLPISVICDFFFIKQEPKKKTGVMSVVVIIHAVIFALFGIGSLIVAAFSLINLLVSSSGTESTMVALYSSLIIAFLFAVLFLRTIMPKKLFKMRRYFVILMIVIVGVICAFGIFGPIADARLTRNDKLIENNLGTVVDGVSTYATDNKKLPSSLSDLKLTGDTKKLVTDNLVTYKKDSAPVSQLYHYYKTGSGGFYYQLCVTYKKASKNQYSGTPIDYGSGSDYSTYVSTSNHPAGEKCYKLVTSNYDVMPMTSDSTKVVN